MQTILLVKQLPRWARLEMRTKVKPPTEGKINVGRGGLGRIDSNLELLRRLPEMLHQVETRDFFAVFRRGQCGGI